ncbi:N-LYSINE METHYLTRANSFERASE [Salix purpurea]|uniref:N-LYSINE METHYLTRANSFERASE n=1 Tax=Salix purpurea TaxID=77065 RepID=A0A9Q0WWI8_SALPP|nr:N-LYSINE METHYLTRANSFERASE [Salix purpurea]
MERNPPVRKPHTSTADLLTWSETPPPDSPSVGSAPLSTRSHQPSDGISKVVFGGQVTEEEFESLNKRKPCSGYKMKEMTGSGIFAANGEDDAAESGSANPTPNSKDRTANVPASNCWTKQRELSGTLESESDAKLKKQISDAKSKELSGHDIFAPPPEILPRPTTVRALALQESIQLGEPSPQIPVGGQQPSEESVVKTAKKIYNQKFNELSGNDMFKGDAPPSSAEKPLSVAKLQEMSGNDIFADGKVESRDFLGGVRKPPGGESSIALV